MNAIKDSDPLNPWADAARERPLSAYIYGAHGRQLLEQYRSAFAGDLDVARSTHSAVSDWGAFVSEAVESVSGLAESLGVSRQSINELLRERRALSPDMALRLSRLFGNSPEFWLNAQRGVDLWEGGQAISHFGEERVMPGSQPVA